MIKPIGARVAIEPIQGDKETESGLLLSDSNNIALPVKGKIIAAGEFSNFKQNIGDIIFFRRYSVDELKLNEGGEEKKFYFCDDVDIIAVEESQKKTRWWEHYTS